MTRSGRLHGLLRQGSGRPATRAHPIRCLTVTERRVQLADINRHGSVYSTLECGRGLPERLLEKHFERDCQFYRVKPAIRAMIDCFASCPTPMGQLLIEHFHGAVTRVGATDTAFPHRAPGYNLLVLGEWMHPKDNEACIAWARNSYATSQPYMGVNRYVNYLADDERGEAVVAAYGPNYRRLQQIKAKYDPDNVFRMNHNISPAA